MLLFCSQDRMKMPFFQLRDSFDNFMGQFVNFLHFPPDILKRAGWECVSHGPAAQTMFKAALPCFHNCDWNSQCLQEPGKKFSVHHFPFFFLPPLAVDGFGWSQAEGRASAGCDPSFGCLEVFPNFFHDSLIPALLACPKLKKILSI